MELTRSEMEIMEMLWQSKKPLSRADILEWPGPKSWKDSSIHILLNGLLSKDAIREAGFVKRSKTYGRTFLPTMTREEYFANMIFSYAHEPQIVPLIKAILDVRKPNSDEISQLKMLLIPENCGSSDSGSITFHTS